MRHSARKQCGGHTRNHKQANLLKDPRQTLGGHNPSTYCYILSLMAAFSSIMPIDIPWASEEPFFNLVVKCRARSLGKNWQPKAITKTFLDETLERMMEVDLMALRVLDHKFVSAGMQDFISSCRVHVAFLRSACPKCKHTLAAKVKEEPMLICFLREGCTSLSQLIQVEMECECNECLKNQCKVDIVSKECIGQTRENIIVGYKRNPNIQLQVRDLTKAPTLTREVFLVGDWWETFALCSVIVHSPRLNVVPDNDLQPVDDDTKVEKGHYACIQLLADNTAIMHNDNNVYPIGGHEILQAYAGQIVMAFYQKVHKECYNWADVTKHKQHFETLRVSDLRESHFDHYKFLYKYGLLHPMQSAEESRREVLQFEKYYAANCKNANSSNHRRQLKIEYAKTRPRAFMKKRNIVKSSVMAPQELLKRLRETETSFEGGPSKKQQLSMPSEPTCWSCHQTMQSWFEAPNETTKLCVKCNKGKKGLFRSMATNQLECRLHSRPFTEHNGTVVLRNSWVCFLQTRASERSFDLCSERHTEERKSSLDLIGVERFSLCELMSNSWVQDLWFEGLEAVVSNEYKVDCVVFRVDPNGVPAKLMVGGSTSEGDIHCDDTFGELVSIIVHCGRNLKTILFEDSEITFDKFHHSNDLLQQQLPYCSKAVGEQLIDRLAERTTNDIIQEISAGKLGGRTNERVYSEVGEVVMFSSNTPHVRPADVANRMVVFCSAKLRKHESDAEWLYIKTAIQEKKYYNLEDSAEFPFNLPRSGDVTEDCKANMKQALLEVIARNSVSVCPFIEPVLSSVRPSQSWEAALFQHCVCNGSPQFMHSYCDNLSFLTIVICTVISDVHNATARKVITHVISASAAYVGVYIKAGVSLYNEKTQVTITQQLTDPQGDAEPYEEMPKFVSEISDYNSATNSLVQDWAEGVATKDFKVKTLAWQYTQHLHDTQWARICTKATDVSKTNKRSAGLVGLDHTDVLIIYLFTHCVYVMSDYGLNPIPTNQSVVLNEMAMKLIQCMTTARNGLNPDEVMRAVVIEQTEIMAELSLSIQFTKVTTVIACVPLQVYRCMVDELMDAGEGYRLNIGFSDRTHTDTYIKYHHYLLFFWLRATLEADSKHPRRLGEDSKN